MLFRLGSPPNSLSDAELASGQWKKLPWPPVWALHLLSLPISVAAGLLVFVAWARFTPRINVSFAPGYQVAAMFFIIIVLGMFLQLSTHPRMGFTKNSVVGVWPSRLMPYTAQPFKMTKARLVTSLLLPFVVLALLPLVIASIARTSSGWLVFGSCLSAGLFGLNIVLSTLALRIPNGSLVAGRGFQPYWRLAR